MFPPHICTWHWHMLKSRIELNGTSESRILENACYENVATSKHQSGSSGAGGASSGSPA